VARLGSRLHEPQMISRRDSRNKHRTSSFESKCLTSRRSSTYRTTSLSRERQSSVVPVHRPGCRHRRHVWDDHDMVKRHAYWRPNGHHEEL
jgi:hypothetical protein